MINENQIVTYDTQELPADEGPWIVFAPHADDESFGMGGTLAKAAQQNIQTHLVVMTDGALGGNQNDLVETRQQEAIRAAAELGMQSPVFLNHQDRELRHNDDSIEQVCRVISDIKPAAVFFPGCFELHPDHRATASIIWSALKKTVNPEITPVSYEVLVQSPVNLLVDITSQLEKKMAAMAIYESQLAENRYIDIALALNKLRSLTLRGEISHAEGFYRYELRDLQQDLQSIMLKKITPYFEK